MYRSAKFNRVLFLKIMSHSLNKYKVDFSIQFHHFVHFRSLIMNDGQSSVMKISDRKGKYIRSIKID